MKKIIYAAMLLLCMSIVGCQKEPERVPVTSISLNTTSMTLTEGEETLLTASIAPNNATDKQVSWSTSNSSVATVDGTGKVTGIAAGETVITVTTADGAKTATCSVTVIPYVPEYVTIGGKKWATMNLGATTVAGSLATCAGDYYAWGEIDTYYGILSWNGIFGTFSDWKLGKTGGYRWRSYCGQLSFVEWSPAPYDSETNILKDNYDVVKEKIGNGWRMPTSQDFLDLFLACGGSNSYVIPESLVSSTLDKSIYWLNSNQEYLPEYSGVAGVLFCDGANRLFFPYSGYVDSTLYQAGGIYWSSSRLANFANYAHCLGFIESRVLPQANADRFGGCSIRPVSD